jgi:hypothetical protein
MNLASSKMSPTAQLVHCSGGLEGIRRLKILREALASNDSRSRLLDQFQQLHQLVLQADKQFLLIAEQEQQQRVTSDIEKIWHVPETSAELLDLSLPPIRERIRQAWTTSTQVSFCAKAYETVPSDHEDNAILHVLAGFMRNGFLHRAIREQGGAYGGGAGQDANSASFRFFSYRDPRLQETLDDFDRAVDWVVSESHPAHQLEEAILGVIAAMDKPSSPAGEAKQAFYNQQFGRTLAHRMAFRKRVLNTNIEDLKAVTERYFNLSQSSLGLITNREALESVDLQDIDIVNL